MHAPSLYEPSAIFCSTRPHPALTPPFLVRRILLRPFRLERECFRSQAFRSARSAHALQAFTQLVDPAASFPPRAAIPTPADPDTYSAAARTFAGRVGRCGGSSGEAGPPQTKKRQELQDGEDETDAIQKQTLHAIVYFTTDADAGSKKARQLLAHPFRLDYFGVATIAADD
ncbi:hypothetical protein C8R44DRAFT_984770 [Mycena epipterygia]|nr:hypothetical protein C8R44DRAFT_984770 [Mycena epipterygia]